MHIRTEQAADRDAISEVTRLAFENHQHSDHDEQFIIEKLRRAGGLSVSLVAQHEGRVVGHVAFSPVRIHVDGIAASRDGWYGLGPLSVLPAMHRKGIGTLLVQEGLAVLRARDGKGCVVWENPASTCASVSGAIREWCWREYLPNTSWSCRLMTSRRREW